MKETENYYIARCKQLIQQKEKWDHYDTWTHYNFQHLQKNIEKDSGVIINDLTLKRFFGRYTNKEDYKPHFSTKDAIALYLGFKNWDDFRKKNSSSVIRSSFLLNRRHTFLSNIKKIFWIGFSIALLIMIGWSILFVYNKYFYSIPEFEFRAESESYKGSSTVTFHYDITEIKSDSVFIDFDIYPEIDRITKLDKNKHELNRYYPISNNYSIRLFDKNRVYKTIKIAIESLNWLRQIAISEGDPIDLSGEYFGTDTSLSINETNLLAKNINAEDFNYQANFILIKSIPVSSLNFIYETRFKGFNTPDYLHYCEFIKTSIFCENGTISTNITDTTCNSRAFIRFGNRFELGEVVNLKGLSVNIGQWNTLKLVSMKDSLAIWINNKHQYTLHNNSDLGPIKGFQFLLNPMGEVDYVRLYENNSLIYSNEFNHIK